MHAIRQPVLLRSHFQGIVQDALKRDKNRSVILCNSSHDFTTLIDFFNPVPADGAERKYKRLQKNQFDFRQFLQRPVEQHTVELLITRDLHAILSGFLVPCVIDADQDAQNVGTQIDAVRFPARVKIHDTVSADAEIVKVENIVADDAAVEARYEELAQQFGMKVEDVKSRIDIEDIKSEVATLKAFEVVKNSAKVTEKTVTREELNAILNPADTDNKNEEKPKKKTVKKTTAKKTDAAEAEEKTEAEAADSSEAPKKKTARKTSKKTESEAE